MRKFYYVPYFIIALLLLNKKSFSQGLYNNANIVTSGAAYITVQDGCFYNNGSFAPANSTVIVSGNAASNISTIGGTASTGFYNLMINKTTNGTLLAGNIQVDGNLLMQSGNLDLNLFNIDLGSGAGAIMNEHDNARITGTIGGSIIKTAVLHSPVAINPGNLGIAITSAADLGNTIIKRGQQAQHVTTNITGINRYYDITPTNNTALNASLQIYYFDSELNGTSKSDLNFYSSEDNGANYSLLGKDNSDAVNNWVLKNNIDKLSRWTLASNVANSLPVKLISFTAAMVNRQTNLQWITAGEINSSYFDVQRSQDGVSFSKILSVTAQGNSVLQNTYHALDANPQNGINYYRLKEVDIDNNTQLSTIVSVKLDDGASFSVYPNPVTNAMFHLNISLPVAQRASIGLYDVNGKLLQQKENILLNTGVNQLQWNISQLSSGIYFLRSSNLNMPPVKVIKIK